jgi:hypothetical protein
MCLIPFWTLDNIGVCSWWKKGCWRPAGEEAVQGALANRDLPPPSILFLFPEKHATVILFHKTIIIKDVPIFSKQTQDLLLTFP